MKLFVLSVMCVIMRGGLCSVVAWPGASPLSGAIVNNFLPPQRTFGYHTGQYINTISPPYSFGYQPQYSYQIPFNYFSPLQSYPTYQPIGTPAYYPSSSFFYPQLSPAAPVGPINPVQAPAESQEHQGDDDSEIIESAEYSAKSQESSQPESSLANPSGGYLPPSLGSKNMPEFPQVPQNFPQYQPSNAEEPTASSSYRPPYQRGDQVQNSEDSISVESA